MKWVSKLMQALPAVLALALSAPALAGDGGRVPLPEIPAAVKGERCVEDTSVMRRSHMDFLLDHRDETMHQGIRTKKHSLKECLECHVGPVTAAQARNDEGHFCKNCHAYAGVRIDCFECHATRPTGTARFHPLSTPNMKAMESVDTSGSAALSNRLAGASKEKDGYAQ